LHPEALQAALGIPSRVVPVAYLCLGRVSHFHDRPELESAGWQPRRPLEQLIHGDHWGAPAPEPLAAAVRHAATTPS
jgi:5,6-dimethylbenzimidazole synthase